MFIFFIKKAMYSEQFAEVTEPQFHFMFLCLTYIVLYMIHGLLLIWLITCYFTLCPSSQLKGFQCCKSKGGDLEEPLSSVVGMRKNTDWCVSISEPLLSVFKTARLIIFAFNLLRQDLLNGLKKTRRCYILELLLI